MAYSFDLDGVGNAKEIALIRDEIDDVSGSPAPDGGNVGSDYFVTDERILARLMAIVETLPLDVNGAERRLHTSSALLDTLATNQAYVLKKQRTLGQEMDGPAVSVAIRAHANTLRKRADSSLAERRSAAAAALESANIPMSQGVKVSRRW